MKDYYMLNNKNYNLSPKKIARKLDVSLTTVYRILRKGEIEYIRIGTQYRIAESDYEKWRKSHKSGRRA